MDTKKKPAPIVLFSYNRPVHTRKTLEALSVNELASASTLYIFSDGPKTHASPEDLNNIAETRKLINSKKWCGNVVIKEAKENRGLADSILSGITEVIETHGKVIVLEDDTVPQPGFLKFMNYALDLYNDSEQVMHVSGYIYPIEYAGNESTFFLKVMSCWGWATWQRAWKNYVHDIDYHLSHWNTEYKVKKFDIEGGAYFFDQLIKNKEQKIYTWAVRWYSSWLIKNGITLFPSKSLVQNIGMDSSGEHCDETNSYESQTAVSIVVRKESIKENKIIRRQVDNFFRTRITYKRKLSTLEMMLLFGKKLAKSFYNIIRKPVLNLISRQIQKSRAILYNVDLAVNSKLYPPYFIIDAKIGKYTYIALNSMISLTSIGKFCSIGPNFFCGYGIHPTQGISTSPMFYSTLKQNGYSLSSNNKIIERKEIKIGNDVFIGANVCILDGVTVSDGAVIAAGAVITKDVPPYAVVGGVPAKILRYRFDEKKIQKLLELKWWDWEDEKLQFVEKNFFDIDEFLEGKFRF